VCIIGISKKRENGCKIAENLPRSTTTKKGAKPQIQGVQRTASRVNTTKEDSLAGSY
jgi:hypothetical protein